MARPQTFQDLMNLRENDFARLDIGLVNLISAKGLPGSEDLDIDACLAKLDDWAEEIREETDRNLRYFRPSKPRDTIGYLKCWTLCKTIRHRKGLRHHLEPLNPDPTVAWIARGTSEPGPNSSFRSAEPVFINGLLSKRGIGSCTSFPVLYTALGQRLGYPIKQMLVVAHVIIRWDDPADRFNMDPGPNYINHHPDGYYIDKPVRWTDEERTCGVWLRPLTPREELGHFAGLRGCVLEANDRLEEAREMFNVALRLMPKCPLFPRLLDRVSKAIFLRQRVGLSENSLSGFPGAKPEDFFSPGTRDEAKLHKWPVHPITISDLSALTEVMSTTPSHAASNLFSTGTVIQHPDKRQ